MASGGLRSIWATAPAREAVSVHGVERQGANWSIRGTSLFKRRKPHLPTPVGVCCWTRRICVQAFEKSSRPKGAGRQPFVQPEWLFSSNDGDNLQGTSDGSEAEESTSGRSWSASQPENPKEPGALYYIIICTANDDKSSLSEPNAGILLSMIGENGKAIMQKIYGIEESSHRHSEEESNPRPELSFRFQRGAVDVITVAGPDLGRLAALWIAPEAGTWRLEKASVTVLPRADKLVFNDRLPSREATSWVISDELKESASMGEWKGVFHLFESNEALLGNDAWLGAAELKPSLIQETSDVVALQEKLLKLSPEPPRSPQGVAKLREESMEEYENLKVSLLGFSSLLVVGGTVSLAALGQGKLAEGFAVGGVGGFLYLLLLQRAVDQLPSSMTPDMSVARRDTPTLRWAKDNDALRQSSEGKDGEKEVTGANSHVQGEPIGNVENYSARSILSGAGYIGLRGRVALVVGVALLLGRLADVGAVSTISPPELLAGVFGFITSKVAVVLAALKPTSSAGNK